MITVRPYGIEPGDYQLVKSWWEEHDSGALFCETILPPLGLMACDETGPIAAVWAYQAVGIGVAFVKAPVSRPGIGAKALTAFGALFEALEATLRTHDYGLVVALAEDRLEPWLERHGFHHSGGVTQYMKQL